MGSLRESFRGSTRNPYRNFTNNSFGKPCMEFSRNYSMDFLGNSFRDSFTNLSWCTLSSLPRLFSRNIFKDFFRKNLQKKIFRISPGLSLENSPRTPSKISTGAERIFFFKKSYKDSFGRILENSRILQTYSLWKPGMGCLNKSSLNSFRNLSSDCFKNSLRYLFRLLFMDFFWKSFWDFFQVLIRGVKESLSNISSQISSGIL